MAQAAIRVPGPRHVGEAAPLARSSDPGSSFEAAEEAKRSGLVNAHEARILGVLRRRDCFMTAHEIGADAHLTNVQVLRRMSKLVSAKKVTVGERRHVCTVTHRKLTAFQIA